MEIRGWQNPISCEDVPAMDNIVAREGMEQRIVPTGKATRGNEIKQRRDFSEKHFPGVAACGFRLVGHGGGAVWDQPSQCMLPGSGTSESQSNIFRLNRRVMWRKRHVIL